MHLMSMKAPSGIGDLLSSGHHNWNRKNGYMTSFESDHLGGFAPCAYGWVYLMRFPSSLHDACIVSKGGFPFPSPISLLPLAHLSSCMSSHRSWSYFSLTSHLTYHISPPFALLPREAAGNPFSDDGAGQSTKLLFPPV
jgi:hypothetical protein